MISLEQMLEHYPASLRGNKESILKEYLQYKILNIIFNSAYGKKLALLGGTAIRIIHGSTRFSEDLDFDNFHLAEREFLELGAFIRKSLELEGLQVEIQTLTKKAYRLKIRIPKLLFQTGLSGYTNQKILIQVDTVPQNFHYEPDKPLLKRFDVLTQINAVPRNLLLAQKICAALTRKRTMGRDFFDIIFLHGLGARPNFDYLQKNLGIREPTELKKYLLEKTAALDFERLARETEPLLFNPADAKKVTLFREFVTQAF